MTGFIILVCAFPAIRFSQTWPIVDDVRTIYSIFAILCPQKFASNVSKIGNWTFSCENWARMRLFVDLHKDSM